MVTNRSFEIEDITGIMVDQPEILSECTVQIMVNGCLYSPQPLCIKMGIGNHVCFIWFLRINMGTYTQRKQQGKNQFFHHIKFNGTWQLNFYLLTTKFLIWHSVPNERGFLSDEIRKRKVCSVSSNSVSNMYTHGIYKAELHAV